MVLTAKRIEIWTRIDIYVMIFDLQCLIWTFNLSNIQNPWLTKEAEKEIPYIVKYNTHNIYTANVFDV